MNEEEKGQIIKKIEETGFTLESYTANLLAKHDWAVWTNFHFQDPDTGKDRELDILAEKEEFLEEQMMDLTFHLIIECKKTDEFAWVFFPWTRDTKDIELSRVNHVDFLTVIKRQSLLTDEVRKGKLPPSAEIRMLNLEPDLFLSYEAIVTPEVARKLKFPSELGII